MTTITKALLAVIITASASYAEASNFCTKYVKAPTVTLSIGKVSRDYRHDATMADLSKLIKEKGFPVSGESVITGLTVPNQPASIRTRIEISEAPDGYCFTPQISIVADPRQVAIYVANELPTDSCLFNATLEHEMKHVEVAENVFERELKDEATRIRAEISEAYGYTRTVKDAEEYLNKVTAMVRERVGNRMAKVDALNQGIDTPDEYRRVEAICKDRTEPKKGIFEWLFGRKT